MVVTKDLFLAFCHCPTKAFLLASGAACRPTEYELARAVVDARYRETGIDRLLAQHAGSSISREPASLADIVAGRNMLALGTTVEALSVSLTYDALERQDDDRVTGPMYVPLVFAYAEKLDKQDLQLAALHGLVLGEALGRPVPYVQLIHGAAFTTRRVALVNTRGPTRLAADARKTLDLSRGQLATTTPPALTLNAHCHACQYRDQCRAEALARDDVSLLGGLSPREVQKLRRGGISTVAQLARTFRPKSVGLKTKKLPKRHLHPLQALAVQDRKVYVVQPPPLPAAETRVFLDVEGMPEHEFYYLIGVVVERADERRAYAFWADDEAGERGVWMEFLALLKDLGDYTLYHYGSYERAYLKRMLSKYPVRDVPAAAGWTESWVNVLGALRTRVYFPVYSNGLKDIGAYLGARWEPGLDSGLACAARRLAWEESRDERLKREIVAYNERDCEALGTVVRFLLALAAPDAAKSSEVVPVSDIAGGAPRRFGPIDFALPEMAFINKCARFNYQREKVALRTGRRSRPARRTRPSGIRRVRKANKDVNCPPPSVCPVCGAARITAYVGTAYSKLVYDLKFGRTGVKRWVVRYSSRRCQCLACRATFYPDSYPTGLKTGHALTSWMAHQHVALRMPFTDVAQSANDLFGYALTARSACRAPARLAEIHRATREKMLERMRAGNLILADETKFAVRTGNGYVWAFTSGDTVVYLYNPTREGTIVKETLGDFAGVLVSDFYAAYDSVACPQQKCHIHLMRDVNEDLCQHPFDEELKELARRYTDVLKAIVDTIDRFGLARKHLLKHKPPASAFLDWVAGRDFDSEIAQGYKTRLAKYGDRLFTFLDHDGVPWNNNSAENAIKLVASRRRLFGTSMSEAGLKDYLVLLSIYQTLRRRGLSLLRFLLSGLTDVEEFAAMQRRRRSSPQNRRT